MATEQIEILHGHHALPFLQKEQFVTKETELGLLNTPPEYNSILEKNPLINDAPQLDAKTEWYYIQAHLRDGHSATSDDPSHTVIVCLFRQTADPDIDPAREHNWAAIYATLDWKTQKYTTLSKVPARAPAYIEKTLGEAPTGISKKFQAMLKSGPICQDVPAFMPDGLFSSPVQVHHAKGSDDPALHLEWDNGALLVGENGSYHLKVPEIELDIQVHAVKPLLLHGDGGKTLDVDKNGSATMFYYSWPRTETMGVYKGRNVTGTSWVDHEYSVGCDGTVEPEHLSYGWNWFSLLTTGTRNMEICITEVNNNDGVVEQYLVYHDESGVRHELREFTLTSSKTWVSAHTFQDFDTCWNLKVPSLNIDVKIESITQNQEVQTWLRMPSFYEGGARFSGTWEGLPIKGFGAMELTKGAGPSRSMEQILTNATSVVREQVDLWIPSSVRPNHFKHITNVYFDSYEEGVIQKNIVDAFYMLNNRGGKNWRPTLFGAAVGLVGGDANAWRSFLVIPELVHTASLIIDDIEDESEARRGGPCVHKVLGVPTTINAGCALYFWGETIIRDNELLTDSQRRDIYGMYFEMMRVGHAGQGLDIAGMTMERLPTLQEAEAMMARVINLHRCKSGVPAGFCGTAGALVGGGTKKQIEAIGAYVQNLGIAFQIRDDVLDVLGKVKGKNAADDLYNHKITYPVAKLFTLDHPDREKWYEYWVAHDVPALVEALKSSGTIDMCNEDIQRTVREGWDLVDSITANSFSKAMFSLFAEFLIVEHY